ncbi:MAG: hypothetical protein D6675_12980 [Gemmatimonadetes bacterium]|nr:MAG: hypothetical protein D6675_12980 [Gemmatimonadota bacterium]
MKTIVAFGAHPDDLEFGATGTIRKLILQGYQAVFVIVTNGENGCKDISIPRHERISQRKKEQMRVAQAMGLSEVVFLEHTDGFLEYTEALRHQLVSVIKEYKPEKVFTFDPANQDFDNINLFHRDHRITAEAVFDACFAAKNKFMYPGEPHRVSQIYFYGTNKPNYFEDITALIDQKLEWLAYHESQFADFARVEQFVREWLSQQTDAYEYSEAFRVMDIIQIT